jgi:signal transduction histidine kinase
VLTQLVLSMTLMTTGLLRVQRRVSQALAERDKAQADLQRSHELLEQRVAQRTAALSEHVANLESFNRSVSHDLRGPLGGIAGVATLARECLDQGDQARASAMLALIETQSERSARLVDALLQLARSGHDPLRVQALDSAGLVNEVVSDLLSRSSPAPGEQVSIQPGLPTVQADPTLLRQVFTNLIGNGLKFASGVHAPRVEIGMESGSAQDAFYVRDNGVGFASDKASELFQPFKRLHSQQFEGSGIGLSIVRRIVERHGGKVWAESAPGQGCIVRFTLGVPQT